MSDIIFISYPKSGRTWLRFMLDELGIKLKYSHMGTGSARHDWGRRVDSLKFDADLETFNKIVFMIRDPRDVVVSFFHQMTRREKLTFQEKCKFSLTRRMPPRDLDRFVRHPGFGLEKIIRFNLGWGQRLAEDPRATMIIYEDMRESPKVHFSAMLSFIGATVLESDIVSALLVGDFNRMKEGERRGIFTAKYGVVLSPTDPADPNSYKARCGKIGSHRSEMKSETIDYCNGLLAETGYFERMDIIIAAFKASGRVAGQH